jgi:hypothetical protein
MHIIARHSFQISKEFEFLWHIFEKFSDIKFYEIPSNGSRIIPLGRTDRHAHMTELIIGFQNAHENTGRI